MFEGIVGKNSLGNIAIDDISVAPGVCPSKCFVDIVIYVMLGCMQKTFFSLRISWSEMHHFHKRGRYE